MKRLLPLLIFLLICSFAQTSSARMNAYIAGSVASTASCSTPTTGDVMNEGFEGCAADGASGCDDTWVTTGSGLTYNYDLPGTPPSGACSKGLRVNADGADFAYYDNSSGIATYWVKFSLYVNSEGLAAFGYGTIFEGAGASDGSGYGVILQLMDDGTTDDTVVRLRLNNGSTSSSTITINTQTWYTVEMCVPDGGETSDVCGEGNGVAWFSIDGGTTKTPVAAVDVSGTYRYYLFGMVTASKTADVIIGNIQIDDDGTY